MGELSDTLSNTPETLSATTALSEHNPPKRKGGMFAPMRDRNFSFLFWGQLISLFGDQAYGLALPWTVLAVTGDATKMALVLAAGTVPRVLLLVIGGALADRLSPRLVMLSADLGRMVVVGALGVTLFAGLPPLWVVAALAALEGAGSGLFAPGSLSLVPTLLAAEDLPTGNGLMQSMTFLSLTIGPLLGGLATAAQAATAFLIDGLSFGVSALTLFRMHTPRRTSQTTGDQAARPSMVKEIRAGFGYALRMPLIRSTMAVTVFGNLGLSGALSVALIVLAHRLSPSPVTLGLLLATAGLGGILGGLGSGLLGRLRSRGLVGLGLFAIDVVLLVAVPLVAGPAGGLPFEISLPPGANIFAVAGVMALITLCVAMADTMFVTVLQQRIAPEYLARVLSIQVLAGGITQPLALVGAGAICAVFGPGVSFVVSAVALAIGILIGVFSREIRGI